MKPLSEGISTQIRSPPSPQDRHPHGRALSLLRGIARPTDGPEPSVRLGRRDGRLGRSRPLDRRHPADPLRFLNFLTGTIGQATSSSFSVTAFFQSFFGALMLFVVGGVLAGIGGWLVRLWWIFLLVGVVTGAGNMGNTARERAERTSDVRVRCRNCGRLNPEFVQFCMACQKPV